MRKILIILITAAAVIMFTGLPEALEAGDYGFRFVRIKYSTSFEDRGFGRGGRRGRGYSAPWQHDYPTAEYNLYEALERTTKVHTHGQPLILTLDDDRIFEYPILYLCEPGYWRISEIEAENLREYFDRGGFVLFDDFRGTNEWYNFYYQIKAVFPDREMEEIPPDHQIWSIYYDVDPVEAPSLVSGRYGRYDDQYFAMFDDKGRMMFFVCYNQDIGDGWEWPNRNVDEASTESFKMGINFIIYALSH